MNKGKRMVFENDIKQIGQGGGGSDINLQAGTGISITTGETAEDKVISVNDSVVLTSDLATVATTGDYDDLTNKPTIPSYTAGTGLKLLNSTFIIDPSQVEVIKVAPNPVTMGPSEDDSTVITAWMKTLPVIVSRGNANYLIELGFNNIVMADIGQSIEVQGYFIIATEATSSPYEFKWLNVCTAESRTGSNTLVNRACSNKLTLTRTANNDWTSENNRYRGTNTSLAQLVDPITHLSSVVYSFASSPAKTAVISSRYDRNLVNEQYYAIKTKSPSGVEFVPAAIPEAPTTSGTYKLVATSDGTNITYTWVLES